MRKATRLAAMAALRQPGSATVVSDLSGLAELSGIDVTVLEGLAYPPGQRFGHNRFMAVEIQRELLDLSRRRACPLCMSEEPYHRAIWDFALATACPAHRVRLFDACTRCGLPFGWDRSDLIVCRRCGTHVTNARPIAVSDDEVRTVDRLHALLRGRPDWLPSASLPSDGSDLIRLAMALGMLLTDWRKDRRVETLLASGSERTASVMIAGSEALANWPMPLHAFLARLRDDAARRGGRFGARKTLGIYYDWLAILHDGPTRRALVEATRGFLEADPVLARRVHRSNLLSADGPVRGALSLNEAASSLGISKERVKRLAEIGVLSAPPADGRGVPMAFDGNEIERLAPTAARLVTLVEAADILAISKARTAAIVDAGLLTPFHRAHADGAGKWAIDRAEIDAFMARLVGQVERGAPGASSVSFETAVRMLVHRRLDFLALLKMAVDGRVRVVAIDETASGLKSLCFDREEIDGIGRDADGRERVPLTEAARRLSMKHEMVAHLLRIGLIAQVDGNIDVESIRSFLRNHVTGSELAAARRTSPRALAQRLSASGILPVVGPGVDGARQNVYRRNDVADL